MLFPRSHVHKSNLQQCVNFAPSFVIIAGPSNSHIFYSEMFLGLASGILIEKPVGIDVSEGRAFLEKSSKSSTYIQIGPIFDILSHSVFFEILFIKKEIWRVILNSITNSSAFNIWRPGIDYRHTVSAKSSNGGGVLFELSHEGYLIWIMGNPNSISGWAARLATWILMLKILPLLISFMNKSFKTSCSSQYNYEFYRPSKSKDMYSNLSKWDSPLGCTDRYCKGFRSETNTPEVLLSIKEELHASYDKQFEKFLANSLHGHKKI